MNTIGTTMSKQTFKKWFDMIDTDKSGHIDEQELITSELDALDEMKRGLEAKYQSELDNLEELRQSILEQAFEGKLTEPVAA